MRPYQGYIIDLDGTTYVGQRCLPEAEDFIHCLKAANRHYLFMTNNATRSIEAIYDHLFHDLNLPVTPDQIYTSATAAVEYLKQNHADQRIMVIGEPSLKQAVESNGLCLDQTRDAEVVLQALQRDVTYSDLSTATQALLKGADFVVTNEDQLIPTEEGPAPSSGPITAFLERASQVKPHLIGKPSPSIIEAAINKMGLTKDQVLVVGDNYETDIQAGYLAGVDTLLVLTGVTDKTMIPHFTYQPTYILDDLSQVVVQ